MAAPERKRRGCIGNLALIFVGLIVVSMVIGVIQSAGRAIGVLPTLAPTSTPTVTPTPMPPTSTPVPVPTLTHDEIRQRAINVSYDDLARNTENYQGRSVHVSGRVTQVVEDTWGDGVTLLVLVTDGDLIMVHYDGPRVLEDDNIELYALVDGRTTYTTVLGARKTVPELTAILLEITK